MSLFSLGIRFSTRSFHGINHCNTLLTACSAKLPHSVNFTTSTAKRGLRGMFKLGLAGLTVGALVGTGYSIHQLNKPRQHIINDQITPPIFKELPKIEPSRQVRYAKDTSGLKLTLYQYQTCPFCCKVRAFLDYHGISYDVIEVDPVLRQSIKWSPYKKVPILVAQIGEGHQPLNDSSMIISALATYLQDDKKDLEEIARCYPHISYVDSDGVKKNEIMNKYFLVLGRPETPKDEERKWRQWVDDVLVHTLSPNVYRTREEALQAFNWFSETGEWEKHFPSWERNMMIVVGSSAMWMIGKRLKKKYQLKDDVRESLYDECNRWARAVRQKGTKFMGGSRPNLADLSVYGVLSSIEGCDAFKDLQTHSKIGPWYRDMKEAVRNSEGAHFV